MKICFYPDYVSIVSAEASSPKLFRFLKEQGVDLDEGSWGGTVESLPTGTPVIVRASSVMKCSDAALAQKCAELGHFCFYDDSVLLADGTYASEELIDEARKFLARVKQGDEMPNEKVISYLKSRPKDYSTLGHGEHIRRQATHMLRLWDKFFPKNDLGAASTNEFPGLYPTVRLGTQGGGSILGSMGFDVENIEKLREAIVADLKQLEKLGLTLTSPDPRAQRLCCKLRMGLESNLEILRDATRRTKSMYGLQKSPLAAIADPLQLFVGTFTSRHGTDATSSGVMCLYRAMLPALIERLVAVGYPDTTESVEWDYGEPSKAFGNQMLASGAKLLGGTITQGIASKQTIVCKRCNHPFEIEIYQELEVDGRTPKGKPQLKGLPKKCPQCGCSSTSNNN